MNSRLQRVVVLLLVSLLAAVARAQAPATQPGPQRFFWKATSPTTEVYLLGSVHVATDDMYPLPPEIEKAYAQAQSLAVEADVTQVNLLTTTIQVMTQGMYGSNDSLQQHVSPETYKSLQAFCKDQTVSIDVLNKMKPVMAAMTVEASFIEKAKLDTDKGIDMHFLKMAHDTKSPKRIVELESADLQFKLIFSVNDTLAETWLKDTLKESSGDDLKKTVKAWSDGDDQGMAKEMAEGDKTDPNEAKLSDLLIYQRNAEMAKKIDAMLKDKEKVFVVVGAAHLIGDKGVLKALEASGYKIERPALTAPSKP